MNKKLPIGYDNFKEVIEKDLYYVDKTHIIEELLDNKNKVVLFPRPRRFGKTLLLSMLENFFNIEKKKDNKRLFDNLYIKNSKYYNNLSSYPVIKLDFKSLKQTNYKVMYGAYTEMIREIYSSKMYLLDILNDGEKEIFNSFIMSTASEEKYQKAINILCSFLYKYYNKKTIILIDEYDVPIQQGYLYGFYNDIVSFIREVFSSSLKGNDNLELAIMTGVLRVSKESLFSDLNNVKVYSIIDEKYNEFFGFTESETKELLKYYNLELTSEVKGMYDGYNFCGLSIYNPWSILNYADTKKLLPFWVNTSGNELIKDILRKTPDNIKIIIEKLLQNEEIEFIYDEKVTFLDVNNIKSLNTILNFLLVSGYLTISSDSMINTFGIITSKVYIPNNEIKGVINRVLLDELIDNPAITITLLREFSENILANNKIKVEEILNKILPSISFMDETESFYHGYVLGLFSLFLSSNCILKSNREAGCGRFDIMIETFDKKTGIIIELKIDKDNDIEKVATNAKKQIKDKEYYQELILDKVENIYEFVIVFKNKKCIVR